jgi:spermidine dehydrogenase
MPITRRDFLNGTALIIAAGLTPQAQLAAQPSHYPPALTGLRGQTNASFEAAHALRDGRKFSLRSLPVDESYDLVVVGGGISGLATAWFYRRANPSARILVLDNLDDFGGHAKRNEFTADGRLLIGYGGSQSLQSPKTLFSPVAKDLLRDLGVDLARFETAFDRTFYSSRGLSRGLFFNREHFGRDVLVAGDPLSGEGDEAENEHAGRRLAAFVAEFPISQASKAQLLALYAGQTDPLAGKSVEEKRAVLKRTSYRDYLMTICGCSEEVARCFQGRTLGFFAVGIDAVAASDARDLGYPGCAGLKLPGDANAAWKEPYIYHFPDGNASVARLLARALVPGLAPGHTMNDVVQARFDYDRLDRDGQGIRIRLNSTCVHVANSAGKVQLAYVRDGKLHRVQAQHAVLACFNMMIPHLMPELSQPQRTALLQNVKAPLAYANVVVRNWHAFERLKVRSIAAPMAFFHQVALDFPVSLGGYQHPRDPAKPIVVHMAYVPSAPNQGLDIRTQYRMGRVELLSITFADYENRIRDQLDRMLGPGGFSSARDIEAITVNRWSHGYSYVASSLFDPDDYEDKVLKVARQTAGHVAIANTDAGGDAWVHYAIDQAERAVRELLG